MPRLFRQSPLNGVWEGSGNVICLDVLRAMRREPESRRPSWPNSTPPPGPTCATTPP